MLLCMGRSEQAWASKRAEHSDSIIQTARPSNISIFKCPPGKRMKVVFRRLYGGAFENQRINRCLMNKPYGLQSER